MKKRDTYKYELIKGNKVVYVGITDDPGKEGSGTPSRQRFRQNENSRKDFYS